jgi:hypothetical protein
MSWGTNAATEQSPEVRVGWPRSTMDHRTLCSTATSRSTRPTHRSPGAARHMVVGAQRLLPALQQVIGEGLQFGGHTVMMHLVPIVLVLPSCHFIRAE